MPKIAKNIHMKLLITTHSLLTCNYYTSQNKVMRLLFILLLLPCITAAQGVPHDFATKAFEACKTNNEGQFQTFIAPQPEFEMFVKDVDPAAPDNLMAQAYSKYVARAQKGFKTWQETAKELELDFEAAAVTKTEVEPRPVQLKKDGKPLKTITLTGVKIFFTCSGKKLCFMISDAIYVNEQYYLGEAPVQLHWLD